jgi:chromosome segregation ATPase
MLESNSNDVKTELALIKKDVKQIEIVFQKLDHTVGQMTDILRTIAVQESLLTQNEKKIDRLEEKLIKHSEDEEQFRKELSKKLEDMRCFSQKEREKHHREILDSIEKLAETFNEKMKEQEKKMDLNKEKMNARMTAVERWRWYVGGVFAVITFLAAKIGWSTFFGG